MEELIIYKQELIKRGFFWNPQHETYQKVKFMNENIKSFYNVAFKENDEFWITNTVHNLNETDKYYMYILFLGKLPKTLTNFISIFQNITVPNKIEEPSVLRYLQSSLLKHGYIQMSKRNHDVIKETGQIVFFNNWEYQKQIEDFILSAHIQTPSNKLVITLENVVTEAKVTLLDCYIPSTIVEMNILLQHIPSILFNKDLQNNWI